MSVLNMVKGLATTKPSTKKDAKPIMVRPELETLAKEFAHHTNEAKSHDTMATMKKDQLLEPAREFLLAECIRQNKLFSAVTIQAGTVNLTYTLTNRYSDVPVLERPVLEGTFGDMTSSYFKDEVEIGLKPESMTEVVLTALVEALGMAFFERHFLVKNRIKVSETFHNQYLVSQAFREQAAGLIEMQTVKPYAASLKLA